MRETKAYLEPNLTKDGKDYKQPSSNTSITKGILEKTLTYCNMDL